MDKLNNAGYLLYKDYVEYTESHDEVKVPNYDFNIVNFFIQIDDCSQILYPKKIYEKLVEGEFNEITVAEYLIKKLLE